MMASGDKDRSLGHLLRQASAAGPAPSGLGPCLDAEALAAWADEGLSPRALAMAEAHVSECARCQAMVAVLMKQPPVQAADAHRSWKWSLGWLVPLGAGVAAVSLWFAVPQRTTPIDSSRPFSRARIETPSAQAPASPPSTLADRVQPVPPQAAVGAERAASADARSKPVNELAKAEASNALRRDESVSGARPAEETPRRGALASQDALGRLAAEPSAVSAAASPLAAPAAAAERDRAFRQDAADARQVASPDPSVRWRIGAGGSVEVSSNGGGSWQTQASGVTADLTAGSAPAPSVCWVVGRGGTVLRTDDSGRTWLRVAFPRAVDLVGVQAIDGVTATVTASDGRVFRTTDAGRTWQ